MDGLPRLPPPGHPRAPSQPCWPASLSLDLLIRDDQEPRNNLHSSSAIYTIPPQNSQESFSLLARNLSILSAPECHRVTLPLPGETQYHVREVRLRRRLEAMDAPGARHQQVQELRALPRSGRSTGPSPPVSVEATRSAVLIRTNAEEETLRILGLVKGKNDRKHKHQRTGGPRPRILRFLSSKYTPSAMTSSSVISQISPRFLSDLQFWICRTNERRLARETLYYPEDP